MRGDRRAQRDLTIAIVTLQEMAKLNWRFLKHRGPTDVLAFESGDVVVCPAVAKREASDRRIDWREELTRYVLHGCLHLRGYRDKKPAEKKRMWARQERLLATIGPWAWNP